MQEGTAQSDLSLTPMLAASMSGVTGCGQSVMGSIFTAGNARCADIARGLLGEPSWMSGREMRWGHSLAMSLTHEGEHQGKWRDFKTGESGDIVDLISRELGLSTLDAIRHLETFTGSVPPPKWARPAAREGLDSSEQKLADAKQIAENSQPLKGSLAESYLRQRLGGYEIPVPVVDGGAILFCLSDAMPPRRRLAGSFGAMIAIMTDPTTGAFRGIQRTFIDRRGHRCTDGEGRKLPPRKLGKAGIVRLWSDDAVALGLGLGEGIETTISAQMLLDGPPSWAVLSAHHLGNFPILGGICSVTIYADSDRPDSVGREAGKVSAERLHHRWLGRADCSEVIVRAPKTSGADFNDLLVSLRDGLVAT